jgi:multimeric flavodoxin WrbA
MAERQEPPRVVAVVGSPRPGGNTAVAVAAATAELAAAGARCRTYVLGELDIRYCLGHDECELWDECPIADDAEAVLGPLWEADAVIIASPVYGGTMSGQLKVLFDRSCHRYYHDPHLRARVVGLVAVTAQDGLDETLAAMESSVRRRFAVMPPVFRASGYATCLGDAACNETLLAGARALGRAMAAALGLTPAG